MKLFYTTLFLLIFFSRLNAQTGNSLINQKLLANKEDKEIFEKAETLAQDDDFLDALPFYQNLIEKYPEDGYIMYRLGICYLSRSESPEKSLEYLEKANNLQLAIPDLPFYYGRALHLNYMFNEAITQFQKFIDLKQSGKIQSARNNSIGKTYMECIPNLFSRDFFFPPILRTQPVRKMKFDPEKQSCKKLSLSKKGLPSRDRSKKMALPAAITYAK